MKPKLIGSKNFGGASQNQYLNSRYEIGEHKVKVMINLDVSYANQSKVVCFIWDMTALKWNTISSLHYTELPKARYLGHGDYDAVALEKCEKMLLDRAVWALETPKPKKKSRVRRLPA